LLMASLHAISVIRPPNLTEKFVPKADRGS
jgi:hypothetical protein